MVFNFLSNWVHIILIIIALIELDGSKEHRNSEDTTGFHGDKIFQNYDDLLISQRELLGITPSLFGITPSLHNEKYFKG